ncbi:transposable element Tc1 transposase [Trichonephila clavipes]|nr:transposable element Tc1 transposase [Trichonephila clavipes]
MNSITERRVIHQVKIDPKISAPKIAASTSNTSGRSVSSETVRRVLRKAGYNGRVARKKPLIGKRNRVKRLKFAKEHILKPQQFWNEVISVMRQDNDPKHTAFVVEEWLLYHCRNQLNTLPQSPDLNVIDHLWSHLERAVQKHQITSKEQLKSVLQEEWLNIAPETTRHLVESMPRRLEAVISAKAIDLWLRLQRGFGHEIVPSIAESRVRVLVPLKKRYVVRWMVVKSVEAGVEVWRVECQPNVILVT